MKSKKMPKKFDGSIHGFLRNQRVSETTDCPDQRAIFAGRCSPARTVASDKWQNIGDELSEEVSIAELIQGSASCGISEGPSNVRLGEAGWR